MDKALLLKYWFILDMQFYAFEELSEHKLTAKDIVYASGEVFVGNEAEYLKLANGLMELYPIKEKLDELIETKYTKEEFDSLYDDACEEYKKLINLID